MIAIEDMISDDDFLKQATVPTLHAGVRFNSPLPQKIGPYKIESLLNKGGMSLLYLGTHPVTSQPIAIKVLVPKYFKHKEMVSRFLKEAQIIAMTSHPNIVKLYGQGEWEKGLYIAMEFIHGVSLRQFIRQKSLSQKRALEIVLQVAHALSHLHSHGVIHRDLKPENVLITESAEIKVIDFGIAQIMEEIPEEHSSSRLMGTPVYMSPEQKENPEKVTFASDLYSLGIIAYELALGRSSRGNLHLSLLPKSLREIIEKMIAIDPKKRYQKVIDFITDLSEYIHHLSAQKEERQEGIPEQVLDLIHSSQSLLIPKKGPRWPQIDCGVAIQEGFSFSHFYLDFFRLAENRFAIAIAEPCDANTASFLHSSILRGMFRMAMWKKDQHPIQMLHALNRALCEDPMKQKFGLSFLILNPDRNLLTFVSCGYGQLLHIPEGCKKGRILATPNPPLGSDPNTLLLETADNWNSGDNLVLHSLSANSKEEEDALATWIEDHFFLSPQTLAEKLLDKQLVTKLPSQRTPAVLTLQRIF